MATDFKSHDPVTRALAASTVRLCHRLTLRKNCAIFTLKNGLNNGQKE